MKKKITMATAILKDGSKRTFVVPRNFMTIDFAERWLIVRGNIGETAFASVALATKDDIEGIKRLRRFYARKIERSQDRIAVIEHITVKNGFRLGSKNFKNAEWEIINEKNMIRLLEALTKEHCGGV